MSDPQWKKLWSVFEDAAELSSEDRQAFLDQACGDDAGLRQRVEQLLAADAADAGVLDRQFDQSGLLQESGRDIPEQIGPYRVEREIGQGGMGQVFLGRRVGSDFDQVVAIKLVPLGRYSEAVLKRFIQERQILSNLNHEHIARLYDGGTTSEGIPYLIMEHVDGQPIDQYCRIRNLGLNARLTLFIQVCHAVNFAHKQLIVHRDIKPGNVMVDSGGRPRLLDFGIAKLLDPAEGQADPTDTVSRIATPEYASPEQLRGEPLSTSSDVYSLGVLLYELLTGHRPFVLDRGDLGSIVRSISIEQPTRPSATVDLQDADNTRRFRRRLRGDLDNIVMKALRKEADRRYGSAAEFAQDLERYLGGYPVQARPETLGYRFGKFVRRQPFAVTAAVAVLGMLITFSVASYRQARALEQALADARVEEKKAVQIADFLRELFEARDPSRPTEKTQLSVNDLLTAGRGRIRNQLSGQPEVQASLMRTLAVVHANLSQFDEALGLITESVRIYEETLGSEHTDTLMALLSQGRVLGMMGQSDQEVAIARRVLAVVAASSDADSTVSSQAQNLLAAGLRTLGEYEESLAASRSALATRIRAFGEMHTDVASVRITLGYTLLELGQFDEAMAQFEQAYEVSRKLLGDAHPRTIDGLSELANLNIRTGDYALAERQYRTIIDNRLASFGRMNVETAAAYNHWGLSFLNLGQYPEAERALKESLEIQRGVLGEGLSHQIPMLDNLALLYTETQRYDEALEIHQRLLAFKIDERGAGHWSVGLSHNNMGLIWQDKRQLARAEASFRQARPIIEKAWGSNHPQLAYSVNNLAIVLHDQGKSEEAELNFKQALRLRSQGLPPDDPALATTLHEYGRLLLDLERFEEARPMIRQALEIRLLKLPENDWRVQHTQALSAQLEALDGNLSSARDLMEKNLDRVSEQLGSDHWRTVDIKNRLQALSPAE